MSSSYRFGMTGRLICEVSSAFHRVPNPPVSEYVSYQGVEIVDEPWSPNFKVVVVDPELRKRVRDTYWKMHHDGTLTNPFLGREWLMPIRNENFPASSRVAVLGPSGYLPWYNDRVLHHAIDLAFAPPPQIVSESEPVNARVTVFQKPTDSKPMEDFAVVEETDDLLFLAVFDGHGSPDVGRFCADNAFQIFSDARGNVRERIVIMLTTFDLFCAEKDEWGSSGAVAAVVVVEKRVGIATCVWIGDCFACTVDSDGACTLVNDPHESSNPREQARIMLLGGFCELDPFYVWRSMGNFNPSRVIGDYDYKKTRDVFARAIAAETESVVFNVKPNQSLLLCSDGFLVPTKLTATDADEAASKLHGVCDDQTCIHVSFV